MGLHATSQLVVVLLLWIALESGAAVSGVAVAKGGLEEVRAVQAPIRAQLLLQQRLARLVILQNR